MAIMKGKPRTSIIITTYNGEKYVERAMESALNQADKDREIIVVDDGSTDTTKNIIGKYKKLVKLILHKKNKRVPAALNSALSIAQGRYVVRLDDDDYFAPDLVKIEADLLDRNSDIDFLYCDYYLVNEKGETTGEIELPEYSASVIHNHYLVAVGTMIRKKVFDEIGLFDEKIHHQEMYDFYIRAVKRGLKGVHLGEKLFYYTRRPGQVTADFEKLKYYTELIRIKHGLTKDEVTVKW